MCEVVPNIFLHIAPIPRSCPSIATYAHPCPPIALHVRTHAHPCPPMIFKLRPCIQKSCNVHYPPTPSLGWLGQIKGRSLSLASTRSATWLVYSLHPRSLTPIWRWMHKTERTTRDMMGNVGAPSSFHHKRILNLAMVFRFIGNAKLTTALISFFPRSMTLYVSYILNSSSIRASRLLANYDLSPIVMNLF